MVIRDLTLRSAASFGSFHLIRLLYDEYMFYLIEHRVAAHQGSAPIQVMSEVISLQLFLVPSFVNVFMQSQKEITNGTDDEEADENIDYKDVMLNIPLKTESPSPMKKIKIS
jgi:hypothetical protein